MVGEIEEEEEGACASGLGLDWGLAWFFFFEGLSPLSRSEGLRFLLCSRSDWYASSCLNARGVSSNP